MSTVPAADRRAAFEQLFTLAYEPLQRFLRRRTDPTTAEDVLGDVLLVLWRRIDDVPPEAPLAWAYGVARGCLANAVRGAGRQQRLVHRLADQRGSTPPADAGLEEALDALPAADRELLHLWAWEQLAPREIAIVLGISANAASIRLHRATSKLRKELLARKDGPPPGHPGERQGKGAPR